jgi:peptide/nickel transport system substrate-binding protein
LIPGRVELEASPFHPGADPRADVWRVFSNSPGENAERYSNPEMDRLLDEADRAVDDAKRRAIYDRIQEIEHRDVPIIFLFWFVNNNAVAANVQGYDVSTFGETPPEEWSTR